MKRIVIFGLLIFQYSAFTQIVIDKFGYDNYKEQRIAGNFEAKLSEKLKRSFHILEEDIGSLNEQIAITKIREYFRESISPKFEPATYILSGKISTSDYDPKYFNFNLEIKNVKTRVITASISEENLDEKDLNDITENVYYFLKYNIPMYFKIISYLNEDEITTNFGKDLSADNGDELEVVSLITAEVIGSAEITEVFTESSSCEFDLFSPSFDFNNMTFRDYYLRTKINPNKAEKYRKQISSFSLDVDRFLDKRNNWLIFSLQNFEFKSDSISRFFNKKSFAPVVFGLQLNLSRNYTRLYFKGRASLSSEMSNLQTADPNKQLDESLVFWSAGVGIQHIFPILDLLFPGLAFEVNYTQFHFKQSVKNLVLSVSDEAIKERVYKGVDIELNGNVLLKISSVGLYADVAYHLFPYLQDSDKNDLSTSAFSGGIGFCFYF